ncbi:hypothetical protein ACFOMD_01320 [Sphingoaurantiacus capsulatus]|uniref:Uncharacterized protein n=1 Tax=Sphingoaurantiacus capsulatus TaxID=1771310 RepID=A0ABV7X5V1_9SPHN
MRTWLLALGGLLVWAAHFFALYAFGSVFETTMPARAGTGIATLAAIAANLWLLRLARRPVANDGLARWIGGLAIGGVAVSLVAVIWQGLVAVLA